MEKLTNTQELFEAIELIEASKTQNADDLRSFARNILDKYDGNLNQENLNIAKNKIKGKII